MQKLLSVLLLVMALMVTFLRAGNYCGRSWVDAQRSCGTECNSGKDWECNDGEHCYADVTCGGDV